MSPVRARLRPSAPRWGLAAFVGAVLMGLLGMHALAMSCATDQAAAPAGLATTTVMAAHPAAHATDGSSPGATAQSAHDGADAKGSMSSALMGVCVGLVVSVMVLLAAVRGALGNRGWQVPSLKIRNMRWALPATRRPPPALTLSQLCLLRC